MKRNRGGIDMSSDARGALTGDIVEACWASAPSFCSGKVVMMQVELTLSWLPQPALPQVRAIAALFCASARRCTTNAEQGRAFHMLLRLSSHRGKA